MRVVRVGADDPRAAEYANLTDVGWRQQMEPAGGLFLAEGEKVISRAVVAGCVPRSALLTERWRLTLYAGQPRGELLDLREDPFEIANRFGDGDLASVRGELAWALADLQARLADDCPRPSRMA